MARSYTVAMREKGIDKPKTWLYVDCELKPTDTATRCKPLTRDAAGLAKQLLITAAAKHGRPIECRIVILAQ